MKINTLLTGCLFFIALSFFLINCAGTRETEEDLFAESETTSGQDNQQQDLEDIEALLGIQTEESTQKKTEQPAKKQQGEQLQLLDTKDHAKQETTTSQQQTQQFQPQQQQPMAGMNDSQKREYESKIKTLESQLKQKDATIQDLNTKLNTQSTEIVKLSEASRKTESTRSFGEVSSSDYQARYDEGRQAFEQRNYQEAISIFESLLGSNAKHSLADNAQFWIGESHFALKQYDAAIMDFEKVFTFANSNKRADAQFKLGMCYMRKGDRTKAIEEWDRLRAAFPNSEFNARVQNILSKK